MVEFVDRVMRFNLKLIGENDEGEAFEIDLPEDELVAYADQLLTGMQVAAELASHADPAGSQYAESTRRYAALSYLAEMAAKQMPPDVMALCDRWAEAVAHKGCPCMACAGKAKGEAKGVA